ncbi:hypothetical protein [Porphyromonas gingivalis]|uniref:hypothetical protein n=1 Tax=Porphyromonas gingivalis TaxID=837 RepID=UPI00211B64E4|nr:hypothetical protein [Porphyromonas gingivalis]
MCCAIPLYRTHVNYRGKKLKIFKRNRPDKLPRGQRIKLVLRLHASEFLLIGIAGYYCVPTLAGWIIGAGGGIGSYGCNVNQTAQRGTQGAYTGSKAMIGGAQVLLPVMSSDVSKGHSLKRRRFPPVEKEISTSGKFIFHQWKDSFPLVEIRRVPNGRLTHNNNE